LGTALSLSKVYGQGSGGYTTCLVKHLITGAAGFLGTHLAQTLLMLDPQAEVVSLGLIAPNDARVKHLACDLLDTATLTALLDQQKPDRVYHLAGSARVSQNIGMPEYYRSNFQTTVNLIDALEEAGHPVRLFFSSSVHVYGNQPQEVDEVVEPSPNGPYGMSKYLSERALELFAQRRPLSRVVVGRLYSCIGPGQAEGFVTSDLTRKLLLLSDGQALQTGPLSALRRFLDVRDAVQIIALLLEKPLPQPFETVNIASPFEMQVSDVVDLLVKASGKQVKIQASAPETNSFQGLKISIKKQERLVPAFAFRPIETTLSDLWQWGVRELQPKLKSSV
jgi:nucleoside-diphosphate-sugar epimerase